MKKITLSIGLLVGVLSSSAQSQCDSVTERNKLQTADTLCTYFTGNRILEFNYYTNKIVGEVDFKQSKTGRYFEIEIPYGDALCLHLSDKKNRVRTVIATYFDGTTEKNILTSKDNVYYSQLGVVKVQVGTARTVLIDRY
tara:strand:- start:327 stop:746 length:420 start_codon:yes stop_codon:yes gene_type:complete